MPGCRDEDEFTARASGHQCLDGWEHSIREGDEPPAGNFDETIGEAGWPPPLESAAFAQVEVTQQADLAAVMRDLVEGVQRELQVTLIGPAAGP